MDKYTTSELIAADKNNIEVKKVVISNDSFALTDAINNLSLQISRLVSK